MKLGERGRVVGLREIIRIGFDRVSLLYLYRNHRRHRDIGVE